MGFMVKLTNYPANAKHHVNIEQLCKVTLKVVVWEI